uniref:Putative ovule protein n=2 Tax=Solanum chacoense TaxID=4108 RepID=A0A0V0GQW8_SOLCH
MKLLLLLHQQHSLHIVHSLRIVVVGEEEEVIKVMDAIRIKDSLRRLRIVLPTSPLIQYLQTCQRLFVTIVKAKGTLHETVPHLKLLMEQEYPVALTQI